MWDLLPGITSFISRYGVSITAICSPRTLGANYLIVHLQRWVACSCPPAVNRCCNVNQRPSAFNPTLLGAAACCPASVWCTGHRVSPAPFRPKEMRRQQKPRRRTQQDTSRQSGSCFSTICQMCVCISVISVWDLARHPVWPLLCDVTVS